MSSILFILQMMGIEPPDVFALQKNQGNGFGSGPRDRMEGSFLIVDHYNM